VSITCRGISAVPTSRSDAFTDRRLKKECRVLAHVPGHAPPPTSPRSSVIWWLSVL